MGAILVGFGCSALALCYEAFRFRFGRFIGWIVEPGAFWFGSLSAAVLIVLFRYAHPDHERAFQYAGLLLQLLGILAVARGISQKLWTFGRTSLRTWFVNWGRQFVGIFRRPRTGAQIVSVISAPSVSLGMAVSRGRKTPLTWEELAELMRLEIDRLDGEIKTCNAKIENERGERIAADDKNRQGLEEKIARARALTERAMIGSFRDEIVGVIWLASGTMCATIPKEIAGWW